MPPKKKNLSAASGHSTKTNKRTIESHLPGLAKRRKYAEDTGPNEKRIMDSYCWICHQSGKDIDCKDCQRVYHTHCLNRVSLEFSDDTCPECQLKSLNNVNQSTFLTVQILRDILSVAATEFRKKFKSPDKNMFFQWPNIEDGELVRIIDFDLLEDNIKDENNPYQSLSEIMSDIKWIHHNYCILDGVDSPTAKEAEGFVRMFQKEIADIEDCPNCYYSMFVKRRTADFFINICNPPHDIIWAAIKGSSHWPAKCLRVENGKAHVRFFGTHDKSNIPIGNKKCLALSLTHPTHKKSKLTDANLIPKKREYKIAVDELLIYIDRYERKFCKKFAYCEPGTPYKGEVIKPGRKRRNRNRRNVSTVSNPEENNPSQPTSESDLNDLSGNQSCSSSQIEVGTIQEDESFESLVEPREGVESEGNIPNPSSSPVVTASMLYEIENNDDPQTVCNNSNIFNNSTSVYTSQNLYTGTRLSQSNFQPLVSCSSTPHAINSTSNYNNQLSINRLQNFVSNNENHEELIRSMCSESQQMHSDSDVHLVESIPYNIPSSSVSENIGGDDDVIFLSSNRRNSSRQTNLNPASLLPYIFGSNPEIQSLFRDGRYVFDSLFIRCWAFANEAPRAPALVTGLISQMRKLTLEINQLQREKEELKRNNRTNENETLREKVSKLTEENDSLKRRYDKTKEQLLMSEEVKRRAIANANSICQGLYRSYITKFQDVDLSLLEETDLQLRQKNNELAQKTRELGEATKKLQQSKKELNKKAEYIQELSDSLELIKREAIELKAKNHELEEGNKLEELMKLEREKMSRETKNEVKGMVTKHLNDLGLMQVQQPSSSGAEFHEQNRPIIVQDNTSGSSKKSSRSSSSKSQDAYHKRASHEAVPTDQHFCQQTISQEHVQIAKKSSVIQLEHSKTVTTTNTRNEGNIYPRTVNAAYDYNQHIAHRERYHAHSPTNFLRNSHGRDRQLKDPKKRQSRYSHHDNI